MHQLPAMDAEDPPGGAEAVVAAAEQRPVPVRAASYDAASGAVVMRTPVRSVAAAQPRATTSSIASSTYSSSTRPAIPTGNMLTESLMAAAAEERRRKKSVSASIRRLAQDGAVLKCCGIYFGAFGTTR
jgi:hypothetical protein